MKQAAWPLAWLEDSTRELRVVRAWRGVESQYASATTRLVRDLNEHDVLEALIEASKPPLRPMRAAQKHFLLTTPFRYTPLHGSRFRAAGLHGVWYGAARLATACAEVAWWRTRFIAASEGLAARKLVTHHTFFAASVRGPGIDLTAPPWNALRSAWIANEYVSTQALGRAAEDAGLAVIRYESARDPGHACLAALKPDALREPPGGLDASREKWICSATRNHAMMLAERNPAQRMEWAFRD